jgi:hypothetical protein
MWVLSFNDSMYSSNVGSVCSTLFVLISLVIDWYC